MRVAILSNVTVEILASLLKRRHTCWFPSGFDQWIQECISPSSELIAFKPECIFVLMDGRSIYESSTELALYKEAVTKLAENFSSAWILLSSVDIPKITLRTCTEVIGERKMEACWNQAIAELVPTKRNIALFDLKELVENIGRNNFYDSRMRYAGSMPFSLDGFKAIASRLIKLLEIYSSSRKKVLALDLDNTLWKGVIGEDGPTGIKLYPDKEGKPFSDFQKRIKELKDRGTILVCLSKNNETDVEPIWDDSRMILKKDDFVNIKINWKDKAENLTEAANDLNLGIDSFVFIDDNPAEREQMKNQLPAVTIPDFPYDDANLELFISNVANSYFLPIRATEEDANKTSQYQAENARKSLAAAGTSIQDYLRNLDIVVSIAVITEGDLERVAQLSQKTNQFNVCTNRYTEGEIRSLMDDPSHIILTVRSHDRFGDNGLVSFVHVSLNQQADSLVAEILDFVMSCRVMNRTIEFAIEEHLERILTTRGVSQIIAHYKKTAKNAPVCELYERFGFSTTASTEAGKNYVLNLRDRPALKHYTTIEERYNHEPVIKFFKRSPHGI